MAEIPKVEIRPPKEDGPDSSLPTLFADGVLNLAPSADVVKFYLCRQDPSYDKENLYITVPIAQVVMTVQTFIQTVAFFSANLKIMVARKIITPEQLLVVNQQFEKFADQASNASKS